MREMNIEQVNLNLLPALAALLDERHVSRAATRLRLSQPATSRALQQLRRHFGDELLVRGPAGYSLTPRAERIRGQLATTLAHLEHLFANETFDPATAAQSFRLAASDYTVSVLGPGLVRTILTESPNSTVAYEPLDEHTFEKLDAGTLDLAVFGRAAPQGYRSQHLFTDRFVCVVAADHPLKRRKSVSLSQYLQWPHLNVEIGQPGIDLVLETLGTARHTMVTMRHLVLAANILPGTELVLTVPARLAPYFGSPARTRILAAPREFGDLQFHTVWHPRLDDDPSHCWLRDTIRAVAAATKHSPTKSR